MNSGRAMRPGVARSPPEISVARLNLSHGLRWLRMWRRQSYALFRWVLYLLRREKSLVADRFILPYRKWNTRTWRTHPRCSGGSVRAASASRTSFSWACNTCRWDRGKPTFAWSSARSRLLSLFLLAATRALPTLSLRRPSGCGVGSYLRPLLVLR